MNDLQFISALTFSPHISLGVLVPLGVFAALLLAYAYWQNAKALAYRALLLGGLFFGLLGPSIISENRTYLNDIVLLVVDETTSQTIGDRPQQIQQAKTALTEELRQFKDIDVQIVSVKSDADLLSKNPDGTHLFKARDAALDALPNERIAATIMITDGQIHDAKSQNLETISTAGPIHGLITGEKGEIDRVIAFDIAPSYAIINKPVKVKFQVRDYGVSNKKQSVVVTVQLDGEIIKRAVAITGQQRELELDIPHGGANHVILEVEPLPGEISSENNIAVATINGVRDRLKVLLISGEPHIGERGWRNILKSDPSVDLIHFTILRPPEKQDGTPLKELSLIPFPIIELFEQKLNDFDLIVFDRYRKRGVLSTRYLNNIVNYVENGGALLEAAGPSFASPLSLYATPLAVVLPGSPTGTVFEKPYQPKLNDLGQKHPVTRSLNSGISQTQWGRWFRLIDTNIKSGTTLMTGAEDRPLLVLNRQGKGRVAQLMSDHAWLWGRGFEGGGPQAELFRRIAHWLMKEPELEEEHLTARLSGRNLVITRQSLSSSNEPVQITLPGNITAEISLTDVGEGLQSGSIPATVRGIYKLRSDALAATIAVGSINPVEEQNIRATDTLLKPATEKSRGGIHWISGGDQPSFIRTSPSSQQASPLWWGLRANKQYQINGYTLVPLFPPYLAVFILMGICCLLWWKEGR
ncbi:MAG: hypothetical protein V7740_08945 [Pseudomonas marincola]